MSCLANRNSSLNCLSDNMFPEGCFESTLCVLFSTIPSHFQTTVKMQQLLLNQAVSEVVVAVKGQFVKGRKCWLVACSVECQTAQIADFFFCKLSNFQNPQHCFFCNLISTNYFAEMQNVSNETSLCMNHSRMLNVFPLTCLLRYHQ